MGPGRVRRLVEELSEEEFPLVDPTAWSTTLLTELDYAMRPAVHERRVPSFGAIVEPVNHPQTWAGPTGLEITGRHVREEALTGGRKFADGLSSWLVRGDDSALVVFDRPAGSERDLVVIAEATGATLVQRHPSGVVRLVGEFGVLRWDGVAWHHEPPVKAWIDEVSACCDRGDEGVVHQLLEFAVHDLGSRGIGALLIYRPLDVPGGDLELRLPEPPPLRIDVPADLAPLRHVLAQTDGAAVFDASGTLRMLGVRLVPSSVAEADVDGYRGMRHTAGRRYSFDDPTATVVVVSEDGPVTVLRRGELLGQSEG
jgi:hypothetical protein